MEILCLSLKIRLGKNLWIYPIFSSAGTQQKVRIVVWVVDFQDDYENLSVGTSSFDYKFTQVVRVYEGKNG